MRTTRPLMGMPITVDVIEVTRLDEVHEAVYDLFTAVDQRFSTYKDTSEITRINRGELIPEQYSTEMREVLLLAEQTKQECQGFFNIIRPDGTLDPSGIVKGWAIQKAAELLHDRGYNNFSIDAGGDVQTSGVNEQGNQWSIGIRNPFIQSEIIKVVYPRNNGVATSGSYVRGSHIYNPHELGNQLTDVVSITVIGPTILDADRMATAAFAMGKRGVDFIEGLPDYAAYSIDAHGVATMTSTFEHYTSIV